MVKYINDPEKLEYFNYVVKEVQKYKSSGSKLVIEKLDKIDTKNISDTDIREICKLVEFLRISEGIEIFFIHEWFKYVKI